MCNSAPDTARFLPGKIAVRNMTLPVEGLGFGCALIAREVFHSIVTGGIAAPLKSQAITSLGLGGPLYDFFAQFEMDDGDRMSEDFSFCRRAREAGFEILGYAGGGVLHTGHFDFGAPFARRLQL